MFPKKEVVAMLLAGGQGSRLGVLTRKIAKPAVPFGGKYRIIDFPLSNCVNSGIEAVGILTQYQPLVLNEYIGNGQPWDLDGMHSGVNCLSPYQAVDGADWYSGTANAIFQNINYIDRYDPEYVVVLSGDHIYKMDYNKMLEYHKEKNAACTIAVIDVPLEEASRFGILNTHADGEIYEFDEKPEKPKSTHASMGIYIFSYKELRKYLIEDDENKNSSHDFGKDVLPAMLNAGERMFAYPFEGYWKDVGTIDSLWEANMDLLDPNVTLDLKDIYSRNPMMPPHFVSNDAVIQNSLVADGCNVYGNLEFSILFSGVTIGKGATINSSIIMPGAVIEEGATVQFAIIAENTVVRKNAVVGAKPEDCENRDDWGIAVVGENSVIDEGAVVKPKEMIDRCTEVKANEM
ncbi:MULTISPECIES: glucose-1-phosphate adenylyltransferase [Eubacteriales]|jgi:glucose-1-phosphate adenylyltransferase|uniref:glucose-1-phosphate adenylyltransferase n=1 Tax=Eubacteriales TaxID=186802 RepID=UPI000E43B90F|nr:glucose-1-phosphate adenylyltransferase [Eubacterium sp. OM08-24]RGM19554.1 glucose-1-phosphate adenylyltransferase [Eubacterium sp. OM08-24]